MVFIKSLFYFLPKKSRVSISTLFFATFSLGVNSLPFRGEKNTSLLAVLLCHVGSLCVSRNSFFSLSGFMTFFVLFFQTCTGYDHLLEAENLLRRQTTILEPLVRIGHDNHFIRAHCVHIPLHVSFRNPSFLPNEPVIWVGRNASTTHILLHYSYVVLFWMTIIFDLPYFNICPVFSL